MGTLRMFSGDYGWIPKKKIKPKVKLFADDDFKFFVFISIFIFCLAGLVLLITGFYLRPTRTRYQFFAGPDFEAIAIFIIVIGFIFDAQRRIGKKVLIFFNHSCRILHSSGINTWYLWCFQ